MLTLMRCPFCPRGFSDDEDGKEALKMHIRIKHDDGLEANRKKPAPAKVASKTKHAPPKKKPKPKESGRARARAKKPDQQLDPPKKRGYRDWESSSSEGPIDVDRLNVHLKKKSKPSGRARARGRKTDQQLDPPKKRGIRDWDSSSSDWGVKDYDSDGLIDVDRLVLVYEEDLVAKAKAATKRWVSRSMKKWDENNKCPTSIPDESGEDEDDPLVSFLTSSKAKCFRLDSSQLSESILDILRTLFANYEKRFDNWQKHREVMVEFDVMRGWAIKHLKAVLHPDHRHWSSLAAHDKAVVSCLFQHLPFDNNDTAFFSANVVPLLMLVNAAIASEVARNEHSAHARPRSQKTLADIEDEWRRAQASHRMRLQEEHTRTKAEETAGKVLLERARLQKKRNKQLAMKDRERKKGRAEGEASVFSTTIYMSDASVDVASVEFRNPQYQPDVVSIPDDNSTASVESDGVSRLELSQQTSVRDCAPSAQKTGAEKKISGKERGKKVNVPVAVGAWQSLDAEAFAGLLSRGGEVFVHYLISIGCFGSPVPLDLLLLWNKWDSDHGTDTFILYIELGKKQKAMSAAAVSSNLGQTDNVPAMVQNMNVPNAGVDVGDNETERETEELPNPPVVGFTGVDSSQIPSPAAPNATPTKGTDSPTDIDSRGLSSPEMSPKKDTPPEVSAKIETPKRQGSPKKNTPKKDTPKNRGASRSPQVSSMKDPTKKDTLKKQAAPLMAEVSPKKETPKRQVSSKKNTPKKDTPKKDTPKKSDSPLTPEVSPKKKTHKNDTPQVGTAEVSPKKETPKRQVSPKKDTPKKDTPKKDTPKKSDSPLTPEVSPKKKTHKNDTPQVGTPRRGTPKTTPAKKKSTTSKATPSDKALCAKIEGMTVAELRSKLSRLGISRKGRKDVLKQRLLAHLGMEVAEEKECDTPEIPSKRNEMKRAKTAATEEDGQENEVEEDKKKENTDVDEEDIVMEETEKEENEVDEDEDLADYGF
jgi:hypothetical protein